MAEDFGKNFIPQKRVDPRQANLKIYHTVDSFTAVSILVFATVCFITIGIFVSGFFMNRQIEGLQKNVAGVSSQFNQTEVTELVSLDKKVSAVSEIISSHTSLTEIREFLEDNTQSNVQVLNYAFTEGGLQSGGPQLVIGGEALSYNTLANQLKIFEGSNFVSSVEFTDVGPTETGTIAFTATLAMKPSAFSYGVNIQ